MGAKTSRELRPILTYHIITTNCTCQSDVLVRRFPPRWRLGPKCRTCRRTLGDMEWKYEGTVRARTEFEAHDRFREQQRAKIRAEKRRAGLTM